VWAQIRLGCAKNDGRGTVETDYFETPRFAGSKIACAVCVYIVAQLWCWLSDICVRATATNSFVANTANAYDLVTFSLAGTGLVRGALRLAFKVSASACGGTLVTSDLSGGDAVGLTHANAAGVCVCMCVCVRVCVCVCVCVCMCVCVCV